MPEQSDLGEPPAEDPLPDVVVPATETSFLRWRVTDGADGLVGNTTLEVQGPRNNGIADDGVDSQWQEGVVATVVDNVGQGGYSGLDLDPVAGQFMLEQVAPDANPVATHDLVAGESYRVRPIDAPDGFTTEGVEWLVLDSAADPPMSTLQLPNPPPAELKTAAPSAEPEMIVMAAPPGADPKGAYQPSFDSSDPVTWYSAGSPAEATEINSFTSSFTQSGVNWILGATWTRPSATGAKGWSIEYTVAPERWGAASGTTLVPQPDRSQGGMVIIIENSNAQNYTTQRCTYTSAATYPGTCVPVANVLTSPDGGFTMVLSLTLTPEFVGQQGCPSTLGSTGYIRSWTGNKNIQAWVAPVTVNPPSTCDVQIEVSKTTVSVTGATTTLVDDWTFTGENSELSPGSLIGTASQTTSLSNSHLANWIMRFTDEEQTAMVTLSETVKPGWTLTQVICNTVDLTSSIVVSGDQASVNLNVTQGGVKQSCVFTNTETPKPADVTWSKIAEGTETLLGGSEWTLTGPEVPADTLVVDCTSAPCAVGAFLDQDPIAGQFKLMDLPWGDYTLTESKSPVGYSGVGYFDFTIDVSNGGTTVDLGDATNSPLPGAVSWSKVDAVNGDLLGGSEWKIVGPAPALTEVAIVDCTSAPCLGPDVDPISGQFELEELEWGSYTVTETKAPPGYIGGVEFTFTVDALNAGTVIDKGEFENEQQPGVALPLTGGLGSDIFNIAGAGIALLALILVATYAIRLRRIPEVM